MFYVFNKQKIYTYLIASSTVIVLLVVSIFYAGVRNDSKQVSATTSKLLPIYSVDTNKKWISLTINCAWNADDIDQILSVLEKNNVKATFFMVGDWVDKYSDAVKKIADSGHEIRKSLK